LTTTCAVQIPLAPSTAAKAMVPTTSILMAAPTHETARHGYQDIATLSGNQQSRCALQRGNEVSFGSNSEVCPPGSACPFCPRKRTSSGHAPRSVSGHKQAFLALHAHVRVTPRRTSWHQTTDVS